MNKPMELVIADVLLRGEPEKVDGGSEARQEWLLAAMWILEAGIAAEAFDVDLFRRRLIGE